MTKEYREYIARERDRILETVAEFIAIPSVTGSAEGTRAAVGFLERELTGRGFEVSVHETDGSPIVVAEAGPEDAPCTLLTYGHYDVFPISNPDEWRSEPFEARVDGDRLYGRGAGDNKGQILAQIEGIDMVRRLRGELPVRVRLLIEGEEETGSRSLPGFVRDHRDALDADLCVYSDGPMFPGDRPVLLFGVRGALCFELVATGARRVLHSGNFGGIAPKPALRLVRLLAEMVDAEGNLTVPGALEGAPEPSPADREALRRLPFDRDGIEREMGVAVAGSAEPAAALERLLLRPAFNLASFGAGFQGDGIKPVIPHEAVAKIDIRLVGDQDPDRVLESIRSFIRDRGYPEVTCRRLIAQPPSKTALDGPWTPIVAEAVERGFGEKPLLVPSLAATTPDYVFTKLLGIPSIVVPYAPYDENNHAPNECTKLSCLFAGIRSTAYLLESLAVNGAPALAATRATLNP